MSKIDWSNINYDSIYTERYERAKKILDKKSNLPVLKEHYKSNWAQFINDWMVTYDPRKVNSNSDTIIPFILFDRQVDYINWVYTRWTKRERGLAEKSRDVGLSWLSCACAVCLWLFNENANIGFGSRKKESVDNGSADPDSLFWKCRKLIEYLPDFFIPEGFGINNKWGLIYNPENRSTIKGEIGDSIGMGGRTTLHFVDEADALEHPMLTEASLSSTTDCRIDVSTTNNVGTVFYNNRRSLPEHQVFIFDWTDDPRKRLNKHLPAHEEPWYLKQLRELDRTVIASQIDRNPNAALSNTFLPTELIENAENRLITELNVSPSATWRIGVDASGMGNDETVFWRRRGTLNLPPVILKNVDGIQMARRIEQMCDDLLKIAPIGLIAIEKDGPGGSCADQLKYGPYSSVVRAIHTGIKINDGVNYNFRSWLHSEAKHYLKEEEPFLPRDNTFKAQATSLLHQWKGGMLLIESKLEYKRRLSGHVTRMAGMTSRSPDRWDSFVLTFTPVRNEPIRAVYDNHSASSTWTPLDHSMGY